VVTSGEGRLSLQIGAGFDGALEHWHYDTFRVTWKDRIMGRAFVTFRLDVRGQVAAMDVQGQEEFSRVQEAEGGRPN
jgi:hypothetical protein